MKQTVLICDWCQANPKFAVTSVTLSSGSGTKGGVRTLDLCGTHKQEIDRLFRSRSGTKPIHSHRPEIWEPRKNAILDVLAKEDGPIKSKELIKLTKIPQHALGTTLRALVKENKIRMEGPSTRGYNVRWVLV
jgi:predicted HTH transcriptional regulator